jgi:flavorubredoxin
MEPRIDEIADRIWRISTYIPDVTPEGFTFNQFVLDGEEPLLYHTGMRSLFPLVSAAVDRVVGLDRLRWIAFSHLEADESGAMNEFLAAAPNAQIAHSPTGVMLSVADQAARPPHTWLPDQPLDIGGRLLSRKVQVLETPHVPHNWEAQVVYEETTGTLFCGDLGTQIGDGPAVTTDTLRERAATAETLFHQLSSPQTSAEVLHRLAELEPRTLAVMHGSSFAGDGAAELRSLAEAYTGLVAAV